MPERERFVDLPLHPMERWRYARSAEELSAAPKDSLPEILWDILKRLERLEEKIGGLEPIGS